MLPAQPFGRLLGRAISLHQDELRAEGKRVLVRTRMRSLDLRVVNGSVRNSAHFRLSFEDLGAVRGSELSAAGKQGHSSKRGEC